MSAFARRLSAPALTANLACCLVMAVPTLAFAQATDHTQHTQSMPGMQMPMNPPAKKAAAKQKRAATPDARNPTCQQLLAKGKPSSKQYAAQCLGQPNKDGKKKLAPPMAPMDHSKMQGMDHSKMEGMDHSKMEGMDHSTMEGMDHSKMEGMDHLKLEGMDHSKMEGMDHSTMDMGAMNMQGGAPPPDARDPDYSDGVDYGPMHGMDMSDNAKRLYVLFDNLELRDNDAGTAQAINAQAWYGADRHKLWLKLDGERSGGRLGATRAEALWNHAIATYWGAQVGVRHDMADGPTRDWLAVGVQGLAPYWFDLQATAYLGQSGRSALRVEADYELLFTQRLILQPNAEASFYGKDDPARGIGSGLSDLDIGIRLRYEITRKFAPYIGVVWSRKFGNTANFTRAAGEGAQDTQLVAGIRIWF
ncbi:copper resistance protein B [Thermomonas sp.]|uniref:copper resistance protein B n=1 Tax=Thermomonas sp. TaxID=1971895 RepID=UPI002489F02A|nr:copper resistance protein B [Thermomonas sp.]MDI1253326.1 copper resistance protein B [Thermomonas sp.]